jgi:hypothetical protein
VRETNKYAREATNKTTKGGRTWKPFEQKDFKAFLGICIYMGIKKLPDFKDYWFTEPFLRCPVISSLMSRQQFLQIMRCLHVTKTEDLNIDRASPQYDKMYKVRWLFEEIGNMCKENWNLGQHLAVDEMMIKYKGSYCLSRQYMPKKPVKWGLKIWCLTDSISKYVYNFDIYSGAPSNPLETNEGQKRRKGEPQQALKVVKKLTEELQGRHHCISMDNFFSSVELFRDLEAVGIYASGTIRSDRVGLPSDLKKLKEFKKNPQGTLDWRMHQSRKMCLVLWKDKQPVLLLSTHSPPTPAPGMKVKVPRRRGAVRKRINTSPVLKEYTTYMRGVDVADQLREVYTCRRATHKWWHRLFFFLLDTTICNMYIIYKTYWQSIGRSHKAMNHKQFRIALAKALTKDYKRR